MSQNICIIQNKAKYSGTDITKVENVRLKDVEVDRRHQKRKHGIEDNAQELHTKNIHLAFWQTR